MHWVCGRCDSSLLPSSHQYRKVALAVMMEKKKWHSCAGMPIVPAGVFCCSTCEHLCWCWPISCCSWWHQHLGWCWCVRCWRVHHYACSLLCVFAVVHVHCCMCSPLCVFTVVRVCHCACLPLCVFAVVVTTLINPPVYHGHPIRLGPMAAVSYRQGCPRVQVIAG